MLIALWYSHSPEGRCFLDGRDIRMMLVAAGVISAYILLRTRPRFSHQESPWWTFARMLTSAVVAAALLLGVDWVRGEDWIFQLLGAFSDLDENEIRYLFLMIAGWLGWSIAIHEGLRRMVSCPKMFARASVSVQKDFTRSSEPGDGPISADNASEK